MAQLQQENDVRARVKSLLSELAKFKAGDLARKDLGSDLNFESGVIFFSRILRLFHALNEADLDDLSFQKLTQIEQVGRPALDQLLQVQNFSLAKYAQSPIAMRNQIIDQIRDSYDGAFEVLAPIIAFTVRKGTDFERLEDQAKDALKKIDQDSQTNSEALKKSREAAEQAVEAVRKIAQEAGVSAHFVHFKQEADSNVSDAKPWLGATILLAAVTMLSGVGFVIRAIYVLPILTPSQSVQLAIPKIFIFSVLLSAAIWTGRTYRAHRHNAVVNRHRQNALATFQAFASAASDEATKSAVLLQATQCIFSPQPTGYIQGEPDTPAPPVLEIFRNLGKSGG